MEAAHKGRRLLLQRIYQRYHHMNLEWSYDQLECAFRYLGWPIHLLATPPPDTSFTIDPADPRVAGSVKDAPQRVEGLMERQRQDPTKSPPFLILHPCPGHTGTYNVRYIIRPPLDHLKLVHSLVQEKVWPYDHTDSATIPSTFFTDNIRRLSHGGILAVHEDLD